MKDESPRPFDDLRGGITILSFVCQVLAFPAILLTTRLGTWGPRFLGLWALAGFIWPFFFAAFHGPHSDLASVLLYWYFSIVWLLAHRLQHQKLVKQGYRCTTHFMGTSLSERGDDYETRKKARARDTLLFLLVSVCLLPVAEPLAKLFVLSGFAKLIVDGLTYQAVEARMRQMNDAQIQNEFYVELFRQRNRNS